MAEEQEEEDKNKRIRPRERALGQKLCGHDLLQSTWLQDHISNGKWVQLEEESNPRCCMWQVRRLNHPLYLMEKGIIL